MTDEKGISWRLIVIHLPMGMHKPNAAGTGGEWPL
jgi:hypothetical protein